MAATATTTATTTAIDPVPTGLLHYDPLVDDVTARHSRLCTDRERLFAPDKISIDTLDVDRSVEGGECGGW